MTATLVRVINGQKLPRSILLDKIDRSQGNFDKPRPYAQAAKQAIYVPYVNPVDPTVPGYVDLVPTDEVLLQLNLPKGVIYQLSVSPPGPGTCDPSRQGQLSTALPGNRQAAVRLDSGSSGTAQRDSWRWPETSLSPYALPQRTHGHLDPERWEGLCLAIFRSTEERRQAGAPFFPIERHSLAFVSALSHTSPRSRQSAHGFLPGVSAHRPLARSRARDFPGSACTERRKRVY